MATPPSPPPFQPSASSTVEPDADPTTDTLATDTLATDNIVLTGFMGTGKSTVGKKIAARLRLGFVDTDSVIEERHGPIPEIFATKGDAEFRVMERTVAAELGQHRGLVVATGGRLMLDPANIAALGANGQIFCLSATAGEVYARVKDSGAAKRPLLAGDDPFERVQTLLAERKPYYACFPQVASGLRPSTQVAEEIAALASTPADTFTDADNAVRGIAGTGLLLRLRSLVEDAALVALSHEAESSFHAFVDGPGVCVPTSAAGQAPADVVSALDGTGVESPTVVAIGDHGLIEAVRAAANVRPLGPIIWCPTALAMADPSSVRSADMVILDAGVIQSHAAQAPEAGSLGALRAEVGEVARTLWAELHQA